MSDPLRWRDDPDAPEDAARLLRAHASPPAMPASIRAKVGATVAGLATGAVASSAAASTAGAGGLGATGLGAAKVIGIVAVALTIGTAGIVGMQWRSSQATEEDAAPVESVGAAAPETVEAPVVEAPIVEPPVDAPLVEVAPEVPAVREAPRPRVGADAPSDPLAEEARLLRSAHEALETDPSRALALATTHARRFPDGQLAAERELVAIDALARLGRDQAARTRAARLGQRYAGTPYPARAERILAR